MSILRTTMRPTRIVSVTVDRILRGGFYGNGTGKGFSNDYDNKCGGDAKGMLVRYGGKGVLFFHSVSCYFFFSCPGFLFQLLIPLQPILFFRLLWSEIRLRTSPSPLDSPINHC